MKFATIELVNIDVRHHRNLTLRREVNTMYAVAVNGKKYRVWRRDHLEKLRNALHVGQPVKIAYRPLSDREPLRGLVGTIRAVALENEEFNPEELQDPVAIRRPIMNQHWLRSYLSDSVRKNLCMKIYCTTCGATDFRKGVYKALAKAESRLPQQLLNFKESTVRLAHALAKLSSSDIEEGRLGVAVRCLVFDLCNSLGEVEVESILGESWAGNVLRGMQRHHRALTEERLARARNESPESTRKRRQEKKRLKQEKHQKRLALKAERDRLWRESQRKADSQTDK